MLVGVLTIYLVENNIIKFQSDLDFEETQNIEQYILDWDTIVNDSKYAYDGSIRLQSKFFDNVNDSKYANTRLQRFTINTVNAADNFYDYSLNQLCFGLVFGLYQITGT